MTGNPGDSRVVVKRDELLEKIRRNRDGHRDQYERAMTGFKAKVTEWFLRRVAEVSEGKNFIDLAFAGPVPTDHTADYDRVIAMLEMEVRDEITISEIQFAMYVLDDWGWKAHFIASNSNYVGR